MKGYLCEEFSLNYNDWKLYMEFLVLVLPLKLSGQPLLKKVLFSVPFIEIPFVNGNFIPGPTSFQDTLPL